MQINKIPYIAVLLLACITFSGVINANANMIKKQGVAEIAYKGWGAPSAEIKKEAFEKAKLSAFNRYIGTFDKSKLFTYEKIRPEIESNLDRYIIDCKTIDDLFDKKTKIYKVVVEATINSSLVEVEIQKHTDIQQTSDADKSYISFVFVARQEVARKSYNAKVSKVKSHAESEKEKESSSHSGNSGSATSDYQKMTIDKHGGSTLQRSDEIEYDVSNSSEINNAMVKILTEAGYEVVEAEYLEEETEGLVKVKNFIEDFRYGSDISGKTKRNAIKGCRSVEVYYFAIGTMDVGTKDIDPTSGLTRVYVSVNGKVLDLHRRFPKTVASVGPIQFAGLGPNQTVATRNALKLAGEKAAESLVSQMRAKGIK